MFNFHFEELYKLYVKDKYESECADYLIANCSLNYICNTHEGCTDHELSGLFDLYIQDLTDLLHLLMKVKIQLYKKRLELNKGSKRKNENVFIKGFAIIYFCFLIFFLLLIILC